MSDGGSSGSGRSLRAVERQAVETEFRLGDEAGFGEILLDTHDLSSGGVFLKADLLYEVDEVLSLQFLLPDSPIPISTQGRVAWVSRGEEDGYPAGMGIQFLGLSEDDRIRIARFLEATG